MSTRNRKLAPMTVGKRIAESREKKGITKSQLARLAKTSVVQISTYERDDQMPGLKIAIEIAKALEIPLSYLALGEEKSELARLVSIAETLPKSVQNKILQLVRDQIALAKHREYDKQLAEELK